MPIQAPLWTEFKLCPVCQNEYNDVPKSPISLGCGHSICQSCLLKLSKQQCPFDQADIVIDIKKLPINYALLSLVGGEIVDILDVDVADVKEHMQEFNRARKAIENLAQYLQNVVITSTSTSNTSFSGGNVLTRPMQRKLVTLIHSQLAEPEGRSRAMRAARSIGERAVKELILMHQNPQTLSTALWAAVRQRGCQFLGPAMQEAVLGYILLALEDGILLSRKVLVLFVVQRLEKQFTQASKTSIGHVVQLLYRASCFKVTKREADSSLLQLQEKYRTYIALRKEHDAQIVQIAMEAGLHISPEQWSALLYGDDEHKSHMQSIIDKLQTPASFASSIQELIIALQRTNDPHNLQGLRLHLDKLSTIDPNPEVDVSAWEQLDEAMQSLVLVVNGLQKFAKDYASRNKGNIEGAQMINTKYRTSMCRDILQKKSCPRGANCNFAHSDEELEKYRKRRNLSCTRTPHLSITNNNNPALSPMAPQTLPAPMTAISSPYPSSRTDSNSSPDSCLDIDLEDDMVEMNKLNHSPTLSGPMMTFTQPGAMVRPAQTMYQTESSVQMMEAFKPMALPHQQTPQVNSTFHVASKKSDHMIKFTPTYEALSLTPQMQQQQQGVTQTMPPQPQRTAPLPPRSVPSIYHQHQQQHSQVPPYHHQTHFIEMAEPHPQPPQTQPAMYLHSNQTPYLSNGHVYPQQNPLLPPQIQQYMSYQPYEFQPYNNPMLHVQTPLYPRTALARGGGDFSNLLKTSAAKSATSELSLSIPSSKDDDWSKFGCPGTNSSSKKASSGKLPFDNYIDSGRGSSVGYSSASDAFSPLSNSSQGSRNSPLNDSECDQKILSLSKNIWNSSLSDSKMMNGWSSGGAANKTWDRLIDHRLSDTEERSTSGESIGKSSDHQSTTLDEDRSYSYLKDLSSRSDLINKTSTTSHLSRLGFTSPSSHRPPPGFNF